MKRNKTKRVYVFVNKLLTNILTQNRFKMYSDLTKNGAKPHFVLSDFSPSLLKLLIFRYL